MPTLTSQELAELAVLVPSDFTSFTSSDAIAYYEYLHNKGFEYGTLALSVVVEGDPSHVNYSQYSSLSGKLANAYSSIVADKYNIGFLAGDDAWLEMQFRLMENDLLQRQLANGVELSFEQIDDAHADAFDLVGLPPETFTAHVPVSQLMDTNQSAGDALWVEMKTVDGFLELPKDSLLTVSSTVINNPLQSPLAVLQDIADKVNWSADIFQAFVAVDVADLELELPRIDFPDFWAEFDTLDTFFGSVFPTGDIPTLATEDLNNISTQAGGEGNALPSWYTNTLTWFGVTFAGAWDPVVIDLDGDGIATDAIGQTQYFDLDSNGFAELTGWAGSDDGLLARDLNGNGRIDNGGELFGDETQNGFAALAANDNNVQMIEAA
ncbi:MAG: hypothetical protein ACH254_16135 [Candidatus Thiodiazotropha endolucinida]